MYAIEYFEVDLAVDNIIITIEVHRICFSTLTPQASTGQPCTKYMGQSSDHFTKSEPVLVSKIMCCQRW